MGREQKRYLGGSPVVGGGEWEKWFPFAIGLHSRCIQLCLPCIVLRETRRHRWCVHTKASSGLAFLPRDPSSLGGVRPVVFQGLEHEEFVPVRTIHLNGKPRVLTLKQDLHYWLTWELRFDPETAMWRRKIIKALDTAVM
nr:protease Do-like 7 [Ipomoea batatas]